MYFLSMQKIDATAETEKSLDIISFNWEQNEALQIGGRVYDVDAAVSRDTTAGTYTCVLVGNTLKRFKVELAQMSTK